MNGKVATLTRSEPTWVALRRLLNYIGPALSHVLPSTGRRFADIIPHLSGDIRVVAERWMNAYPIVLNGRASNECIGQFTNDFIALGEWVEKNLRGEERQLALASIYSRIPHGLDRAAKVTTFVARLSQALRKQQREAVEISRHLRQKLLELGKREKSGKLGPREKEFLEHVREYKRLVGEDFDACLEEMAGELVYFLKPPSGKRPAVQSLINPMQGAVGQTAMLRSQLYRTLISQDVETLRRLVPEVMGPGWMVTELRTGRIYTAKSVGGVMKAEYVDGGVLVHQKLPKKGQLPKGCLPVGAQAKAVLDIETLFAQIERDTGRLPQLTDETMLFFLWEGRFHAVEYVATPLQLKPKLYLLAAEGGKLPKDIRMPITEARPEIVEPTITRDTCRDLAWWLLRRAAEVLR